MRFNVLVEFVMHSVARNTMLGDMTIRLPGGSAGCKPRFGDSSQFGDSRRNQNDVSFIDRLRRL